jgi:hypothetical protein
MPSGRDQREDTIMDNFAGLLVSPGEIRLNYALLVVDEPNAAVWHIDTHSKYPAILAYGHDHTGAPEILVAAGEHTLKIDEGLRGTPTRIVLDGLDDTWSPLAEAGRYTIRLVAYRPANVA